MAHRGGSECFRLGPYLWIDGEDTYQLAQTMHGLRMEIVTDAPPPEEEEEEEVPPPPYVVFLY